MSSIFQPTSKNCHITLQVTDVLAVAIKEYEVFQQPTKCGGRKQHKGASADCCFLEPEGANSARSSYRLLDEVIFAFILYIYLPFLSNLSIASSVSKS